jgi:hypothetical protein
LVNRSGSLEADVNYGETHHEGRLRCRCGVPGCIGRL